VNHERHHQTDPLAEIALALAMGFFSIMVLAIVCMGAGGRSAPASADLIEAVILRPASLAAVGTSAAARPAREQLIIFHAGRFLDSELQPMDVSQLSPRSTSRSPLVLAIAPDLSLAEAMDARTRIDREDVVVAILDPRWMQALERNSE